MNCGHKHLLVFCVATILLLFILVFARTGRSAQDIEKDYIITTFPDFSGGLNLFSSPTHIKSNQALNLQNWLFEGTHLRARGGLTKMNTTSKGATPIWGVHKLTKSSGAYQYLASWGGTIWVFDEDTDALSTLIKESDIEDSCIVTNGSATVTGATTVKSHFRNYGYADSLTLYLGDSLRYVKQIPNDSLIILYTAWGGNTDTVATLEPFRVSEYYPTRTLAWLDNAYIVGTQRVGEYDGDDAALQSATPLKYNVVRVDPWIEPRGLALTCTPNREKGYLYFMNWYVSYNDTNTCADSHSVILNIPLRVVYSNEIEDSTFLYLHADSSYEEHISVAAWDSIFMIPEFAYVETLTTIIPDSVEKTSMEAQNTYIYHVYDYSALPAADSNNYNYGCHRLLGFQDQAFHPVRARVNASDTAYFYTMVQHATVTDTVGEGDTLYLVRYSESAPRPNVARYMEIYQDRAWYAGYADAPSYLEYSELFDPDSALSTYFIYVAKDDGDKITALKTWPFQNILLVFKESHIYTISGQGPYDWWVDDLAGDVGTPAWASIVVRGNRIYFYDYSGFYVLETSTPEKISWGIEKIVKDSINTDYAHLIVGGYFDNHIWWSYPSGSATKNNRTILFNPDNGTWTKVDRAASAFHVGLNETDDYGVLWADPDSGKVYQYGQTYFDDGVSYSAIYESGWLSLDEFQEYTKHFKSLELAFDKHDSSLIYITYYKDYSDTAFTADTVAADDSDIFRFYKRAIRGDNIGTRIKVKIEVTRVDGTAEIPFFQIKWKPTGEPLYDD